MIDDLISRQAAIDAIYKQHIHGKNLRKFVERLGHTDAFSAGILDAVSAVEDLPSAQPETRWISCEKRIPTQEGEYLVCDHNERVFIAKFWTAFGEWGDNDIIAWQKAPEPYRKETEDAVH